MNLKSIAIILPLHLNDCSLYLLLIQNVSSTQSAVNVVETGREKRLLLILFISTTCTTPEEANAAKFIWLAWREPFPID